MAKNRRCFVPNCTSGYASNKEQVSLFRAPQEETRRMKWQNAIARADRSMTERDVVCAKHFKKSDVITTKTIGEAVYELRRAQLAKDAVPSIFPKSSKCKHNTKRRQNIGQTGSSKNLEIFEDIPVDEPPQFFTDIYNKITPIQLPSSSWTMISSTECEKKYLVFTEVSIRSGKPFLKKQILIDSNLTSKFYVLSSLNEIIFSEAKKIECKEDLEDVIKKFDLVVVCYGGPSLEKYPKNLFSCDFASIDVFTNTWRHIVCTYVTETNEMCSNCAALSGTFYKQSAAKNVSNALPKIQNKNVDSSRAKIEKMRNTMRLIQSKVLSLQENIKN